jgi:ribose transport system permease protein
MRMLGSDSRSGLTPYVCLTPLVIILVLAFAAPHFLQGGNLANLCSQIAPLVIVTLGQLVVALVSGIDLSVGSVVSLTTCIIAAGNGGAECVPIAIILGLAVGAVNGVAVAVARIHPIIATISMMTFIQGLALYWLPSAGGRSPLFLSALVNATVLHVPVLLFGVVLCLIIIAWLLQRTRFGLRLYAVGANPTNSYFNGISDRHILISAYALSGLLAALAGIVISGQIGAGDPNIGVPYSLSSITAVALGGAQFAGGVGSVVGVLGGALTLGILRNGMNLMGIDSFLQMAITGVLLLVAISFQRRNVIGF